MDHGNWVRLLLSAFAMTTWGGLLSCSGDYFGKGLPVDQIPGRGPQAFTELFQAQSIQQQSTNAVDLLFVVDNSGSMREEQEILTQSFDGFITEFRNRSVDFRIGVTTTDNNSFSSATPTLVAPRAGGTRGQLISTTSSPQFGILNPDTPDLRSMFTTLATVGIGGSATECGMLSAWNSMNSDYLSQGVSNLFRRDIPLAIILVTDEEESIGNCGALGFRDTSSDPVGRARSVYERVRSVKGSSAGLSIYSITNPRARRSHDEMLTFFRQQRVFTQAVDITADFSGELSEIGQALAIRASLPRIELSRRPIESSIAVTLVYSNDSVKQLQPSQWQYTENSNLVSLRLPESDLDAVKAVKVSYKSDDK